MSTLAMSEPLLTALHPRSRPSSVGKPLSALVCHLSAGLAAKPSPRLDVVQLLGHIRSVLISLLSYELQTPLSTIQIAMETLAEGDDMPAQAQ